MLDKVSYSLLRVNDELLANELFLRIKEGEATFADIASNYSWSTNIMEEIIESKNSSFLFNSSNSDFRTIVFFLFSDAALK